MSEKYVLIIGIEKYLSNRIQIVDFAENDANEIYNSFKELEINPVNMTLLISQYATKTIIESNIKKYSKLLREDDLLILFYAGHGFSKDDSNYITCYDTQLGDLQNTSIPIQDIINKLKNTGKVILFLDSCHSGLPIDNKFRGIYSDLNEEELKDFFDTIKHFFVGFASSKTDEVSYPIPKLKHGAWTYHLIQALSGLAKDSLEKKRYLTATSLQNYLYKSIPLTLKKNFTTPKFQTPWLFGGLPADFLIADLNDLLLKKKQNILITGEASLELLKEYSGRINTLSGFKKKSHREPTDYNMSTQNFVENISQDEIKDRTETIFNDIKSGFNLKRTEIECEESDNYSTIITKDFEINISIEQSAETVNEYNETIVLKNISNPEIFFNDNFNQVFRDYFDTLIMYSENKFKIKDFIDSIEDLDNSDITIDYPSNNSHVNIEINGIDGNIFIYPDRIEIKYYNNKEPKKFLETFINSNKYLISNKCKYYLLQKKNGD